MKPTTKTPISLNSIKQLIFYFAHVFASTFNNKIDVLDIPRKYEWESKRSTDTSFYIDACSTLTVWIG
jgi:hypothetical protein